MTTPLTRATTVAEECTQIASKTSFVRVRRWVAVPALDDVVEDIEDGVSVGVLAQAEHHDGP